MPARSIQPPISAPGRVGRRSAMLTAVGLLLLALLAYAPALTAGFIWDDDSYVTQNATLYDLSGLERMWTDIRALPQFYPLTHTTFWLERRIWGDEPGGYHLVNIILHAGSAILLWRLLLRLRVPGALLAAAIFAVHPLHVESVAWVTERKNCLAVFLYLLTFLVYWRMLGDPDESRPARPIKPLPYLLVLLLFAAALLSKTTVSTLPAAIALVLWWKRGKLGIRDVLPLLPMLAMGAICGSITSYLERTHVGARGPDWDLSEMQRILIAGRALWFYAEKVLLPHEFTFIYPRWWVDPAIWWQWLFPAGAIAIVSALFALRNRISRGPLVAALFFAGTCAPALGFFDVYPMQFSFVADHFAYPASIGLIVLFAAAVATILQSRPRMLALVAACAVTALATQTFMQARVYRDLPTLWADTLTKNPGAWMADANLAYWHLQQSKGKAPEARRAHLADAARLAKSADELRHGDVLVQAMLAQALMAQGETGTATEMARKLVLANRGRRDRPDYMMALSPCAIMLGDQASVRGELDEARQWYEIALEWPVNRSAAVRALAQTYSDAGDYPAAIRWLEKVTKSEPYVLENWVQLGDAYLHAGKFQMAVDAHNTALDLRPDDADAAAGMAAVAWASGDHAKAQSVLEAMVANSPNEPALNAAMSLLYEATGNREKAGEYHDKAEKLYAGATDMMRRRNLFGGTRPTAPATAPASGMG